MFGPRTTAAAIDAFESRFTSAGGAHFLIAPNGRDAWPISEAESLAFRALYRRRMRRARWLRRGALLAFIPLTVMIGTWMPAEPRWLRNAFQTAQLLALFGLPLLALAQHGITSDLTQRTIARPLKHRITTRYGPAVTPVRTQLGAFARKLLITAVAIEIAIMLYHAFGSRDGLAAYMRVLYGLQSGNEDMVARFTGNLSWVVQLCLIAGALLLMVDRRIRSAAARAKTNAAPEIRPSQRP